MSRTVVTGIGVIAPTGLTLPEHWSATLRGENRIDRISLFDPERYPSRLAGEVRGFVPAERVPGRLVPQTDRMTRFAIAAADGAFADAAVDTTGLSPLEMGVVTANSSGGFDFGQRELQNLHANSPKHVSAYMSFAWFYAVNSGQLSIRHNLRGPAGVLVAEQAGGLAAVAQARRRVRAGTRVVLTGGVDSPLCPYGLAALMAGGRLSTRDDPRTAYLPFDADAAGQVPGEGGALLVVEEAEAARARGARVYGQIAGYGATFDPRPGSGRPPNLRRAIEVALDDAEAAPADIGVVFADAAAVPELDRVEADALAAVFGPRGVPVTAPKAGTGRLSSGAAPLDLVGALLTLREGSIPPTANTTVDPGYGIDLVVGAPRPVEATAALVVARGVGGFNTAMVVRTESRTGRNPR
ncbi:Polyketide chain length factor WhiE-CLF [Actinokineospora spheciospongiae]|uniref:Polyketide chain length factor WhiE-CLF n=1 Tax=Actinokineospora spheciospongiae TaxID=909613 RepID=W7J2P2_9PSEU|nr:ketosynthase chain-length factor [Actinokineospora spheciospongiae]EWC63332.1 Polyketide chain length factor WhiE-CLF [Actinokineospora spheciospongiae]